MGEIQVTQVFISYSRKDLTFAEQLASDLRTAGFEVWYDFSRLEGGQRWRIEIQNAIKNSQFVIIILSPDSVESEWVEREFLFSSSLKRKIIPLLYRDCELPLNYLDLNYIDVQGDNYQRKFDKILGALNVAAVTLISPSSSGHKSSAITHAKKSPNRNKIIIWAGVLVLVSFALVYVAKIFISLGLPQVSTATSIPQIINTTDAPVVATFTAIPLSEIDQLYLSLGGEGGALGGPLGSEQSTPDGKGRFREFQNGSIYWTPSTGAHEVHGAIWNKWEELGLEQGFLGYPITDEFSTPDKIGRVNQFEGGSIYWTPGTGAYEVHGGIRDRWEALGGEQSCLGYPIRDEEPSSGDWVRQSLFEHGIIKWSPDRGAVEICD
jgi:TIR domain/LGFP repeat